MPEEKLTNFALAKAPIAKSAAMAAKEGPTVTMYFDQPVRILLDDRSAIDFGVGAQKVPEALADHWYLKAHGVRLVPPAGSAPQLTNAELEPKTAAEEAEEETKSKKGKKS